MLENRTAKIGLRRWLLLHVAAMCLLVLVAYLFYGQSVAYAFAVGCLIFILPNYCFAVQFFRETGAQVAKRIVRQFYRAEAVKLVLTAALFLLAFALLKVDGLPCFLGLITMQILHWVTPQVFQPRSGS